MNSVSVPRGSGVSEETVNRVLREIKTHGPVSARAISQVLRLSQTHTYRVLEFLRIHNLVERRWDASLLRGHPRWLYKERKEVR